MKKRYRNALSNLTASQYQTLLDTLLFTMSYLRSKVTAGEIEGTSTANLLTELKLLRGLWLLIRKCRNAKRKEEENFNPNES